MGRFSSSSRDADRPVCLRRLDGRPICLYCQGRSRGGLPNMPRGKAAVPRANVRDRIVAAADRLFYSEGVRAVGIDRVLAEADAAKASLYAHFGCKDELIAVYLERRAAEARARIEAFVAETPPAQRALRFFDWVVGWTESRDFYGCPIPHTIILLSHPTPPSRVAAPS